MKSGEVIFAPRLVILKRRNDDRLLSESEEPVSDSSWKGRIDYSAVLRSLRTPLWSRLEELSIRYEYDGNHNLRYLELARNVLRHGVKHVILLGSGKGVLESILPKDVTCFSVDINRGELVVAFEINWPRENRHFVQADIFRLPFRDGFRTQMVVISEVLEHVERDDKVLEAAKRLLDPEGFLLLTVPNIERLINRLIVVLGRREYFMSEDHLREYRLSETLRMLWRQGFAPRYIVPVYLRLVKEVRLRRYIGLINPLRRLILVLFPRFATYYLILARKGSSVA